MKKDIFLIKIIIIFFLFNQNLLATKSSFFDEGQLLFEKKEFEKSKVFFEKDIVFNPKSEKSYLYLAKIFEINNNVIEQEINLNSVLLLNPKNDEAIYMLVLIKIEKSDYIKAKELIEKFDLVCSKFCFKKNEIQKKFDKLIPENEKNNN